MSGTGMLALALVVVVAVRPRAPRLAAQPTPTNGTPVPSVEKPLVRGVER